MFLDFLNFLDSSWKTRFLEFQILDARTNWNIWVCDLLDFCQSGGRLLQAALGNHWMWAD